MKKLSFQIIFTFLFLFFACSPEKGFLENEYMGLKLKKRLTGANAEKFVNRLHSQKVTSSKNEIGFFRNKNSSAIIYVTFYTSSKLANDNEQRMTGKMATNDKIFSDGITFNLNGYHIFQCKGMGQTHFVFSNKSQLFWISVDSSIAKPFLEAVLTQLKQESIK